MIKQLGTVCLVLAGLGTAHAAVTPPSYVTESKSQLVVACNSFEYAREILDTQFEYGEHQAIYFVIEPLIRRNMCMQAVMSFEPEEYENCDEGCIIAIEVLGGTQFIYAIIPPNPYVVGE